MKPPVEDVVAELAEHFKRPIIINKYGCWLWMGCIDRNGYARYGPALVYGIVWNMSGRSNPRGFDLRHQCPAKNCINPDHILLGTHSENMMDASRAGVLGRSRRISDEDIIAVQRMLMEGKTKSETARAIGV